MCDSPAPLRKSLPEMLQQSSQRVAENSWEMLPKASFLPLPQPWAGGEGLGGDNLGKAFEPHSLLWPMMGKLALRMFGEKVSIPCLRFEIHLIYVNL